MVGRKSHGWVFTKTDAELRRIADHPDPDPYLQHVAENELERRKLRNRRPKRIIGIPQED